MADPLPEWVEDEDKPIVNAVIRLVDAAVESTKRDGVSSTANEAEKIAWRQFVRSLGYGREAVKELAEYLYDRTS